MEVLLLVAEKERPTMMARIGMLQALLPGHSVIGSVSV
jgi:hypothetical protein